LNHSESVENFNDMTRIAHPPPAPRFHDQSRGHPPGFSVSVAAETPKFPRHNLAGKVKSVFGWGVAKQNRGSANVKKKQETAQAMRTRNLFW
jgi:hypothetical protein